MTDSTEQHIEREVARRVGVQAQQYQQQIASLEAEKRQLKDGLVRQHNIIKQLTGEPLRFGTLLETHNHPSPELFTRDKEIVVTDTESPYHQRSGIITGSVDENGHVPVKLSDDTETTFAIGMEGKDPAQIRLTKDDDGTYAVVSIDGKPWEVRGVPDSGLQVGETVKIKGDNHQIVDRANDILAGTVCRVCGVTPDGIEIDSKGETKLVLNPRSLTLEVGDKVVVDSGFFTVLKKLDENNSTRYTLSQESKVTWNDVGGLEDAKSQLRDAIELPFRYPDLYKHYKVRRDRGVLLFGPPGCGKSLLARVCAWAIADVHGKEAATTGYIYVKGPELLDKWVGNTEAEIRSLFDRGRRHYREHGYKALLTIEEAEAILPQRGSRVTSSIADTMVPMFLSEMDGVDDKQTEENPIILLLTNRPDILDPAVTRPGRITKHIKINRPNDMTAIDILRLKVKDVPFAGNADMMTVLTVAASDLYSKSRVLYRVNNEHDFTLGDASSGAMLEAVAESAKMNALHRDMETGVPTGVTLEDFRAAISLIDKQQRGLNHSYDLQDFAERLGIQSDKMQVDRCFAST